MTVDHTGLETQKVSFFGYCVSASGHARWGYGVSEGSDLGAKPELPSSSALGLSVTLRKTAQVSPTPYLHRHFLPATQNRASNFFPPC